MNRPVFIVDSLNGLEYNFAYVLALTTDVETVLGIGNADTLEVEVFNRSVILAEDVIDCSRTTGRGELKAAETDLGVLVEDVISFVSLG